MSQKTYYKIMERPNLGANAIWKRATEEREFKTVTDMAYARESIIKNDNRDNVYYIYKIMDINQELSELSRHKEKWVYNDKKRWHTTNYEQVIVKKHVVDRRNPYY